VVRLKLLNGVSPGRDSGGRLVKPTPNFERGCPEPPADLGARALAEWERITPGLDRLNLLKPEDYRSAPRVSQCSIRRRVPA
jgi:phage terminase small subunit